MNTNALQQPVLARIDIHRISRLAILMVALLAGSNTVAAPDPRQLKQACANGNATACADLGEAYLFGTGVARDYARAKGLYEASCNDRATAGCSGLGLIYVSGYGLTPDLARGRTLLERACAAKELLACARLGGYVALGVGGPVQAERALQLLTMACDGGVPDGCVKLGSLYLHGAGTLRRDPKRAFAVLSDMCAKGNGLGCNDLGFMYKHGVHVQQDHAKARELFAAHCNERGIDGCASLALFYDEVEQNLPLALKYYELACGANVAVACANLGNVLMDSSSPRDQRRAFDLNGYACERAAESGCNNLGLQHMNGVGVSRDEQRAASIFAAACDSGYAISCTNAAFQLETGRLGPRDAEGALLFRRKACELGDTDSCVMARGREAGESQRR